MKVQFINASGWYQNVDTDTGIIQYKSNPNFLELPSFHALQPIFWNTRYDSFAELIVNSHTDEIILARDHMGCQPFYYFYDERCLIFGSNLPDILRHLPQSPELNTSNLLDLFNHTQTYSNNTFYQSIFRVEPGCLLYLKPQHKPRQVPFWQLDKFAKDLVFSHPDDYLECFSELLHESVRFHTQHTQHLGAEMSGGLDSSAILVTAHQQGIRYPLFMHIANPGSKEIDDRLLAEDLLNHIKRTDAHFINADQFDPIAVFQFCAKQFAGTAPYIFFMLAQNIHQAVADNGCKVLLSGAGGDECISGHAPLNYFLSQTLRQRSYHLAWNELKDEYHLKGARVPSLIRRAEKLLRASHPIAYHLLSKFASTARIIRQYFQHSENQAHLSIKPYYRSIREYEWNKLQGPLSH